MNFDLQNPKEIESAKLYFEKLLKAESRIELTDKKRRSISQNSLLHDWFTILSNHLGYTSMEDCKRDVKREILGQQAVINKISGKTELKDFHTSEMTEKEMSEFMTKFKIWADVEFGCYLPYFRDNE